MTECVVIDDAAESTASAQRMSREYRAMARHLGADPAAWQLSLHVSDAARQACRDTCLQLGRDPRRPLALLAAFTTRPQKHWFEERWAALAQALTDRGWQVGLLGGPGDREVAVRITSQAPLLDLVGRLPLEQTVACLADASLVVGVDTGLTHMGAALQRPTVAIFGSTRPYLDGGTPDFEVLYHPEPCSPCRRHPTCGGRFDCMRHWDVDRVLEAVARVTGRPEERA